MSVLAWKLLESHKVHFSAIVVSFPDGNNGTEGFSVVKRVIDFSFHDIDGFL